MAYFVEFVKSSILEIKNKVTWPSYESLQNSSYLVLIATVLFSIVIGVFDLSFKNILFWIYRNF
jgi:preprotein translocase subunit SecE